MNYSFFYIIPLAVYAGIMAYTDSLSWLSGTLLIVSFFMFRLARLRYPRKVNPLTARAAQISFFALTIALLLRERIDLSGITVVFFGMTVLFVVLDLVLSRGKIDRSEPK